MSLQGCRGILPFPALTLPAGWSSEWTFGAGLQARCSDAPPVSAPSPAPLLAPFRRLAIRATGCLRVPLRSAGVPALSPLRPPGAHEPRQEPIARAALLRYTTLTQRGCVAGRRREEISPEQRQERVDEVMSRWQTYPDFAHLFDALLKANGFTAGTFAGRYTEATGKHVPISTVEKLRAGLFGQPTYKFIENIADHALLSPDPSRFRKATDSSTPGECRPPWFAAAGLIEVTPASVAHWNTEVLARWQRYATDAGERLSWKNIMKKLIDFHMQGDRASFIDIADAANAHLDPDHQLNRVRVNKLLNGTGSPTSQERTALARVAGLSEAQLQLIETALDEGTLLITSRHGPRRHRSLFSERFGVLLDRLHDHGLSQRQLALQCICPGQSETSVSGPSLSDWRNGHVEPTAASLRGLVHGLRRYASMIVSEGDIEQLVSAAGFSMQELFATTHDLITDINEQTRLKPLLAAIRNAVDIELPMPAVANRIETADPSGIRSFQNRLTNWELDGYSKSPTESQVLELLGIYNAILRDKGMPELSPVEIGKVMEVAARDQEDGWRRGFLQRAREHKPPLPRRTITPDFDSGPRRE